MAAIFAGAPDVAGASLRYREEVLKKLPVGYWRLGERAGPFLQDETQFKHDGMAVGKLNYDVAGAIGMDPNGAIALDGTGPHVAVSDSAAFSQPTSGKGLTVEVWMKPEALEFDTGKEVEPYVHWLGKGERGRQEWALRFYSRNSDRPNRISAYIWNSSGGLGAGAFVQDHLKPQEWIHIVACYSPGNHRLPMAGVSIYRNGLLRGDPAMQPGARYKAYNIVPVHGAAPLCFGTRDGPSYFAGALDEIAIYPRVLTAAEIKENYEAGR